MTDTADRPGPIAVVYNPIKIDLEALRTAVAEQERATGRPPTEWFETSEEDPGQDAAKRALETGAAVVMAAGGDGTVRAVAEVVARSEAALAILPAGTGNLLARNIHLKLDDVAAAVQTAFDGTDRAIDVGDLEVHRAGGGSDRHTFVVMAGLGLDAKMIEATDDDLKKRAGWLAYVKAIATVLRDRAVLQMRYRVDDSGTRTARAHTLIVANCGSLPGNILLLPDAEIDDGRLDVLMLQPEQLLGWIQILTKVFWENGVVSRIPFLKGLRSREVNAYNTFTGKRVQVKFARPEQIELDGDTIGSCTGFVARVRPGALTVRIPSPVAATAV